MPTEKSNYDKANEMASVLDWDNRVVVYALLAIADAIKEQDKDTVKITKEDPFQALKTLRVGTSIRLNTKPGSMLAGETLYCTTKGWMTITGGAYTPEEIMDCGYVISAVPA